MLKIGMVGAENSHTLAIAKVLNVDKRLRGVRATHVWGETRRYAREAAEAGQIPRIVTRPEEMIGEVDAIVVDHRHGKFHLPAAIPFLETRVPMFIDKPFCCRRAEGRRFLARARELEVPVCSFSTLPKQQAFRDLKRISATLGPIHTVISTGPCDIRSKWGGIFFYGIHQVDLILRLVGYDFYRVQMVKGAGANHSASILFRSGTVATMNLIGEGSPGFPPLRDRGGRQGGSADPHGRESVPDGSPRLRAHVQDGGDGGDGADHARARGRARVAGEVGGQALRTRGGRDLNGSKGCRTGS